jgi:hypothetical protein
MVLPPQLKGAVHVVHWSPELPHAMSEVPATHAPDEQQPPLHAWLALQVVVHWCIDASHACPIGQSLAMLQPQLPAMHAWPTLLAVQSVQASPGPPHAAD